MPAIVMDSTFRFHVNPILCGECLHPVFGPFRWMIRFATKDCVFEDPQVCVEIPSGMSFISPDVVEKALSKHGLYVEVVGSGVSGMESFGGDGESNSPCVTYCIKIASPPPEGLFKRTGYILQTKDDSKGVYFLSGANWPWGSQLDAIVMPAPVKEPCQTLVVLQNAWAKDSPREDWPYSAWVCFLMWSKSGKNLSRIIGSDMTGYVFSNTTPVIAVGNKTLKPREGHVRATVERHRPKRILACGSQARSEVESFWRGPAIFMPHPGARYLEKESPVFDAVSRLLRDGFTGQIEVARDRHSGEALVSSVKLFA